MSNDLINALKAYSEQALSSGKKVGELNLKLLEHFSKKQAEYLKAYVELGAKQTETLSKAKDLNELVSLQQEAAQEFNEQWLENLRETQALLESARNEVVALTQEALQHTRDSSLQVLEAGKHLADENVERVSHAMHKSTAE